MIKNITSIFKDSHRSFHGQEEGERVLLLLRRHAFVILLPMSVLLLAYLAPIALGIVFKEKIVSLNLWTIFLFVSSVWYLFFWLVSFYALTLYSLNTVIVTDKRIIENDQHGFFDREVSELHVHRVQDVSVRTLGVIQTFLRFGDVDVQTAGSEKQFIFRQIGEPEKVKDTIMGIVASRHSGVMPVVQ